MGGGHRGFTFLELLVTLAVLAVLLGTAVLSLTAIRSTIDIEAAAGRLASTFRLARVDAIHGNHRTRVAIDLATAGLVTLAEIDGAFMPRGPQGPLGRGVMVDPDESSRVVDGGISITFQPRGHTADNATVALTRPGGEVVRRVVVASSGRIRVR